MYRLSRGSDGMITTQFTMTTIEELGLLKMDFLGLRTLTVIQNAVKMAERNHGVTIDIDQIDYDDKAVLAFFRHRKDRRRVPVGKCRYEELYERVKTAESGRCDRGDFSVPSGTYGFYPGVYPRKEQHQVTIAYDCPQLEPILAPTYGCIVYQEQVMQIVRDLAGYTWGRSDLVRRAMSKKKTGSHGAGA